MILKTGRPSQQRQEKNIHKLYDIDTINLTINVPKDFHKKLKLAALTQDTTIKDIVIKAINQYLD